MNGGRDDDRRDRAEGYNSADGEIVAQREEISGSHDGEEALALASRSSLSLKVGVHRGPLPAPETFAGYEKVCPGAAARILQMAEEEQKHGHEMERLQVTQALATEKRGQVFGFILIFGFLAVGAVLLAAGVPGAGIAAVVTAIGGTVVGTVLKFVTELRERRAQKKAEEQQQAPPPPAPPPSPPDSKAKTKKKPQPRKKRS